MKDMLVIERGNIRLRDDFEECEYIIRILCRSDLESIMKLQNHILASMRKKELCVPISEREMEMMLDNDGECVGLFIEDKLYAMCSVLFNISYENNMARELGFDEHEMSKVAQFELSLVHYDIRGHNLQQKLAKILAERLEESKRARYLFTTVSPRNYPSIKTVMSLGMNIVKFSKMYYGWDRYVVYKDFQNTVNVDESNSIIIPNTSVSLQQKLLEGGYIGVGQYKCDDGVKIIFAKRQV